MSPTVSHAPPSSESLQARIVSAEIMRLSGQDTAAPSSRMSAADAVTLALLLSVDVAAWCYAAFRGAQALLG